MDDAPDAPDADGHARPDLPLTSGSGVFDIDRLAQRLPGNTEAMIVDQRLVERSDGGVRMFRVNRPVPTHLHRKSDETLVVLSGTARFRIGDEPDALLQQGQMVFFERGTWHSITDIVVEPFVVLAFEVPARDPDDVVFVDATDARFLQTHS